VAPLVLPVGDRVLVYGGGPVNGRPSEVGPLNDGALVDPVDGSVEVVPPAPFSQGLQPEPVGVATDTDAVVLGIVCTEPIADGLGECLPGTYEVAQYSAVQGRWQAIPLPPDLVGVANGWREAVGATAGGEVIFRLGAVEGSLSGELWSYSISDRTWQQIGGPPAPVVQACVVAERFLVVPGSPALAEGGRSFEDQSSDRTAPYLWILDSSLPGAGWQRTPQAPVRGYDISAPEATCLEDGVVVDNGVGRGMAQLPIRSDGRTGPWSMLPPPPSGVYLDVLEVNGDLVLLDASGPELGGPRSQVLDLDERSFRRAFDDEPPFMTRPAVVDSRVVGWPDLGSATTSASNSTLVSEELRGG